VGYLCANFSLPRPLCSPLRPDVRDRQTSDVRQTSDAHRRLMPPTLGAGHNKSQTEAVLIVRIQQRQINILNRYNYNVFLFSFTACHCAYHTFDLCILGAKAVGFIKEAYVDNRVIKYI